MGNQRLWFVRLAKYAYLNDGACCGCIITHLDRYPCPYIHPHLNRDTEAAIAAAGFELESVTRASMRKALPFIRPTVRGVARLDPQRGV